MALKKNSREEAFVPQSRAYSLYKPGRKVTISKHRETGNKGGGGVQREALVTPELQRRGRQSITILEGFQASPACPSDKTIMK